MKFISWNVNGLRACVQKGFTEYFQEADADFFCLQETKLQEGQIDFAPEGYYAYWNYAVKKGLSLIHISMIVSDAMGRIDEVLNEKPLSESQANNIPSDNSIALEHVTYSYDGEKNALNDVSLRIEQGQDVYKRQVLFAAVTSLMNLFETPIEALQEQFGLSRKMAVILVAFAAAAVGIFIESADTVSYTHLDVYKRQVKTHPLSSAGGQGDGNAENGD